MRVFLYLAVPFFRNTIVILLLVLLLYFSATFIEESWRYFPDFQITSRTTIFKFYALQAPFITVQILPFSVLLGAVLTLFLLARSGEITGFRVSGLSLARISIPFFVIGFLFSLFHFFVSEFIVPISQNEFIHLKKVEIEKNEPRHIFLKKNWLKKEDKFLYYSNYQEYEKILLDPEYMEYAPNKGRLIKIIHGDKGVFRNNSWTILNATIVSFDYQKNTVSTKTSKQKSFVTDLSTPPPDILSPEVGSEMISFFKLRNILKTYPTSSFDRILDFYAKLTLPLLNFIFIFLAIPFALRKERQSDTYVGVALCVLTALGFWVAVMTLRHLAIKEIIPPFIAAWFMSAVLLVWGIYYIHRKDRKT